MLLIYRLYLTTSLGNPHFLPAVSNNVTIIDFTVTFDGLQEQLLSNVVKQVNYYPIDGVYYIINIYINNIMYYINTVYIRFNIQ